MVTDTQRKDFDQVLYALKRVEWGAIGDAKCPICGRLKAYGAHPCSCPIRLAFKALDRLMATPPVPDPCDDGRGHGDADEVMAAHSRALQRGGA